MIKTPNAGSTAREGILGRRKRLLPEPAIFVTIWRKDENGHFEQARIPLSEARCFCGARPIPGKPYCAEHAAKAYQGRAVRRPPVLRKSVQRPGWAS